jgi:magnesium and cobalt transporter
MPEHPTNELLETKPKRSLFERMADLLSPEPENTEQLLEVLHDAHGRGLIEADGLSMIEGVIQVAERRAKDVMVPRQQMDMVDLSKPLEEWLPMVLASGRSRFPAFDGERDKVVGVLLAKDLLRHYAQEGLDVKALLRPAQFVPESKKLNVLLRDFRAARNHMAIVVDEYSAVCGLLTIEDVLEQIVGDIQDEHDQETFQHRIVSIKEGQQGPRWRLKAVAAVSAVNEELGAELPENSGRTMGGLATTLLGRVAKPGEVFQAGRLRLEVLKADAQSVHELLAEKMPAVVEEPEEVEA